MNLRVKHTRHQGYVFCSRLAEEVSLIVCSKLWDNHLGYKV